MTREIDIACDRQLEEMELLQAERLAAAERRAALPPVEARDCCDCDRSINTRRLRANPEAVRCTSCQESRDGYARQYRPGRR